MRRILLFLIVAMLLVACGGGSTEPPASNDSNNTGGNSSAGSASEADSANAAEAPTDAADEPIAEDEPTTTEEESTAEDVAEAPTAEEDAANEPSESIQEAQYSGIDPETGLEINPDPIPYGTEFIARGIVTTFNLTPQTEPEFVIKAPNGVTYRIATQGLAEIFLADGSQLKPFEYKIGMEAMATALLAADASLSDVLTSPDFVIIALP